MILLTIQKIVIQLAKRFSGILTHNETVACCEYFFRVLRKRAINDSHNTTLHMIDGTKQNMRKLFAYIMKKVDIDDVNEEDP